MKPAPRNNLRRHRRRGSIYLVVLGYASLVTIIGMSALLALRVQRRAAEGEIDLTRARLHARSAIESGLWTIAHDPDWRTAAPNGTWINNQPFGEGTYALDGVDPDDGDLADAINDRLVFTGTGVSGEARHRTQVQLEPRIEPLACLEVALHAGNDLNFDGAALQSDQTISANNDVNSTDSTMLANVEAVNSVSGDGFVGTTATGISPRAMPDAAVFDYYLANGTPISIFALTEELRDTGTRWRIQDKVISPASNPFGVTTNPEGIYVIDCKFEEIRIDKSRIVGTLVLLDPGPNSTIKSSLNWEPAVRDFPAVLVRGDIELSLSSTALDEADRETNFNPPGTSYKDFEDGDTVDRYPSLITGLVYVSGNLLTGNSTTLDGIVVVGGSLNASGVMDLTYRQALFDNPPPGFFTVPGMRVVAGSWKQIVD